MVFLTAIYSFGQEIGFGVKAGLSLANLTETSYHVRPGLVIGGFANIRFNDYVALQPELQYATSLYLPPCMAYCSSGCKAT